MRHPYVTIGFFVLTCSGFAMPVEAENRREFTKEEQQQLERGELVSRPHSELRNGQRLFGGTSWQRIHAPAHSIWKALVDVPRYPNMVPNLVSAQVVRMDKQARKVKFRHHVLGFDVKYSMTMEVSEQDQELRFRIDPASSDYVRSAWGFIRVQALSGTDSMVSYGFMGDIGAGSTQAWLRPLLQTKLLKVPYYMKRFMEQRGGALRYASAVGHRPVAIPILPNSKATTLLRAQTVAAARRPLLISKR